MNDVVVELDMRSYEDCRKRIRSFDKVIRGAAMRGIKSSAVNVLGDSQRNIKAHDSIATAQLINSGKTKSSMSGQYVDVIYNVIQAFFVEFGRKAGNFWAYCQSPPAPRRPLTLSAFCFLPISLIHPIRYLGEPSCS